LLDADVKKAIDSLDSPAKASMAQAEALLKALGVDNEEDLNALSNYFFVEIEREPGLADGMAGDEEDAPEALERLQKMIQPNAVITAINKFVNDRKEEAQSKGLQSYAQTADKVGEKNKPNEEKEFWDRMSNVISGSTHETWKHLEKALVDYNKTLVQRSSGIDSVSSLGSQNEELKALLNQYLGSRINEELIVPPTDTIKLGSD